ncbi:hypothetical protein SKAU_G00126890 [Synaphobranchus kaupii]|uniref:Uncharacterized protein n=1 Tax=Synaphobranchus kaupii TaxID=118154 RepID=A0A9Q1J2Z1_SYNKA|nr:hypothetical protein SKAU_G00126890 [Synaphobranchus kaupii]
MPDRPVHFWAAGPVLGCDRKFLWLNLPGLPAGAPVEPGHAGSLQPCAHPHEAVVKPTIRRSVCWISWAWAL